MSHPEQKLHNNSIDLFRLLCAVMVISIHTAPLSDVSAELGDLSTNVLPRIAVPYFFATAGYFYICQLEEGKAPMRPYLKRIVTTYLIWSIPYWLISFLTWGYRNPISFTYECIYSFFINGSSYHFWFFPALMLLPASALRFTDLAAAGSFYRSPWPFTQWGVFAVHTLTLRFTCPR